VSTRPGARRAGPLHARGLALVLAIALALPACAAREANAADDAAVPTKPAEAPVVALTRTPNFAERQPAWSPDGKWIAFVGADSAGAIDLWLLSADGASRRRLTDDRFLDGSPAWSPDGARIAFHSAHVKSNFQIWAITLADSKIAPVTDETRRAMNPAWSPDGATIAYFGVSSGDEQVWSIPATGGSARRLTFHPTQSWNAAWSPDGKEIVFSGYRNEQTGGSLFIMPWDGEGEATERSRALTKSPDHQWDRFPAWSPDGRWVAFAAAALGGNAADFDIWLVAVDGSVEVRVAGGPATDTEPTWAPDGRRIAFQSDRAGNDDLWVLDVSRWTAPPPPAR
jgi:Tol biopolymer transport system component